MRAQSELAGSRGFTLIELLLTLTIILLLVSMLLPALNRGHSKVKSLQCRSNLHQTGIAMLFFANAHEDKFPVQVPTNQGGSLEFIAAGQAVQGKFYFSYKHFLPVAPELQSPKVLVCPADVRAPATNFAALRNTNLSYFTAANPVYLRSDSIVSGDRNLTPAYNSIAWLSPYRPLRWTREMHQNRGNVLYADAHVEQLNDVLSLSNAPGAALVSLVMPSTQNPAMNSPPVPRGPVQWAGGGGAAGFAGGNLSVSTSSSNTFVFTNQVTTNLTITSEPRHTPPWLYLRGGPGGYGSSAMLDPPGSVTGNYASGGQLIAPVKSTALEPTNPPAPDNTPPPAGNEGLKTGLALVDSLPWWLLAILLLIALWLLKRARERRPSSSQARERPWVVEGRNR